MSVKGKVKRANKKIEELERKIQELEQFKIHWTNFTTRAEDEELKNIKENFIKAILNNRKPLEHSCCRITISRRQLETMKNSRLYIERSYEYPDDITFTLKV